MSILCFPGFEGFDCSINWMLMILLFFIAAIFRKQVAENFNIGFNVIGSVIVAEVAFIVLAIITTSVKWAFLAGLIGLLVGGFLIGQFFGGEEGGY